jgi:predicted amidohydrolase
MIVDPLGLVVAEGTEQEDDVIAEIDPGQVAAIRQEFPALHDRKLI